MNIRLIVILATLTLTSPDSFAHTTRAREFCGTIASIDSSHGIVEVKSERSAKILNVVLGERSHLLKDWKRVDRSAVSDGVRVCVYYRSPLFGKPYVSKIVILKEGDPCPPIRGGGLLQQH